MAAAGALAVAASLIGSAPAHADKIKNPTAVFAGLDKITGRIISFEVAIGETVQFGSLHITPRVCYSRPQTEAPQTTSFVEVEEVVGEKKFKKVFAGWMFAASPGLHGVEHPVYDAWLTDCKGGTEVIKTAKPKDDEPESDEAVTSKQPVKSAAELRRERAAEARRNRASRPPERRAPTRQFYPQNPGRAPSGIY
ncbi:MAG: DUF2155 domain-containing protein [Beijerinckiaceae bacterium]